MTARQLPKGWTPGRTLADLNATFAPPDAVTVPVLHPGNPIGHWIDLRGVHRRRLAGLVLVTVEGTPDASPPEWVRVALSAMDFPDGPTFPLHASGMATRTITAPGRYAIALPNLLRATATVSSGGRVSVTLHLD